MRLRFLTLLLALAFVPSAFAWNRMGHMMVAAVAYEQLTPAVRAQVDHLLTLNPSYADWSGGTEQVRSERIAQRVFMLASFWADEIKSAPGFTDDGDHQDAPDAGAGKGYSDHLRHRYWHYINIGFSTDGTPVKEPAEPNVLTQMTAFSEVLADPAADPGRKSYALVWLVHLVGDAHQPLHDVSRFTHSQPDGDGGGNKVELSCPPHIRGGGVGGAGQGLNGGIGSKHRWFCPRNLHAFWDDLAGDEYLGEEATQGYADLVPEALSHVHELPAPDGERAEIDDPRVWVKEGSLLAQKLVYTGPIGDGAGPYAIDVSYHNKARLMALQQIALAGARLARLLNQKLR